MRAGQKMTAEQKAKISKAKIGYVHPRRIIELVARKNTGRKHSLESRKKMSDSAKRVGIGKWQLGRKHSIETRKKIGLAHKAEKCNFWKGGITDKHTKIRMSLKYKLWRESVFKRDKYTCVWCGDDRGGNLQADHILPFSSNPDFRFSVANGRTLCIDCHKKRHKS